MTVDLTDRKKIELYSRAYLHFTRILNDADNGVNISHNSVVNAARILYKIDSTLAYLSPDEQLIIRHEVINSEPRYWFREYMSEPTYYRYRKRAYTIFLHCLER